MSLFPVFAPIAAKEDNFYNAIVDESVDGDCIFCLDAGSADSYTSGQRWLDLSGNGRDYFFGEDGGSSTDDPTFNGVAGGLSSSEYMSFDGGDFFHADHPTEAVYDQMHKNNAVWACMMVYYLNTANDQHLYSNDRTSTQNSSAYIENGANKNQFLVGKSGGVVLNKTADGTLGTGAWIFGGVSIDDPSGAGGGFLYKNGAYDQVASADTFDATYSSPASTAAVENPKIGSYGGSAAGRIKSGGRVACVAVFSAVSGTQITKANFDNIYNNFVNPRFSIT